ncbi:DinB family protein [Flavobacterium degerlachei]|jgi:uncharacterized damage-inducible protein DinB|uniref:DinB superfamily protein n=1 Tax=Flavobacterium degerlachei TaxID=229203 RepID=A0A1H2SSD6_9FLAO|nr:DinB family protein [Flavobacterium degerlachei]SDW34498.1 DinB superfamily protein [Flavobacterium degerlachei]
MKATTQVLIELWQEARTRFTNKLQQITENDLTKKLAPCPYNLGFLIRHIGDMELLFAKNELGSTDIKAIVKTDIAQKDTRDWTNLADLKDYSDYAFKSLLSILEKQTDADWESTITIKEAGTKTKAEAFGRIISHTAYHAGQISIIHKYGNI